VLGGTRLTVPGRSLVLLRAVRPEQPG
jgi:hypothetical protein